MFFSTAEEWHLGQCISTFGVFFPSQFSVNCFIIKDYDKLWVRLKRKVFECRCFILPAKLMNLSKKAKKAEGLEQHKKLQREKDQKRKEKKQVSLPAKHSGKGKK